LKKKIFYWSPGFAKIATFKAVINSAKSLAKYDNNHEIFILNFFGEFNNYKKNFENEKIEFINFFNKRILQRLPKYGWLKSRITFLFIFITSFFPLKNLLKKTKPDFLVIHLVSSLPLILLILFNFRTKFVLRISGYPRLTLIRKLIWKIAFTKIYAVTCPTKLTKEKLLKANLIDEKKIHILYDPIINVHESNKLKKSFFKDPEKKFFLAAGRLTNQKNFEFLINAYEKFIFKSDKLLLIAGEGEEKKKLKELIFKKKLQEKIFLIGHVSNIFKYMKNCEAFILTSLWEDPGFVLIEAAFCRANIISSNCKNGPIEFIENNECGFGFETNNLDDFEKQFHYFINANQKDILHKKINAFKKIRSFSCFRHYKSLVEILN